MYRQPTTPVGQQMKKLNFICKDRNLVVFPLVFITGGIRRGFDGQFEALNVDQLVILNLLTKCARVKKLVGLVTQHRLFAVNLSQRPKIMGTELLLFGNLYKLFTEPSHCL